MLELTCRASIAGASSDRLGVSIPAVFTGEILGSSYRVVSRVLSSFS
jgi:hypothetical protein